MRVGTPSTASRLDTRASTIVLDFSPLANARPRTLPPGLVQKNSGKHGRVCVRPARCRLHLASTSRNILLSFFIPPLDARSPHCPPCVHERVSCFPAEKGCARGAGSGFVKFAHLFVYRHTIELKTRLSLYECVDTDGVCAPPRRNFIPYS